MQRRGQAAMEFLMTYGWAILVVLVVIGALAYFGILNPSTLLPERCELQMGIACKDHLVTTNTSDEGQILFTIENGRGSDIYITRINAYSSSLKANCSVNLTGIPRLVLNGAASTFTLDDNASNAACVIEKVHKDSNTKIKWDIDVYWYAAGSTKLFTHTADGQLLAKVE